MGMCFILIIFNPNHCTFYIYNNGTILFSNICFANLLNEAIQKLGKRNMFQTKWYLTFSILSFDFNSILKASYKIQIVYVQINH